jgi:hypothetical protein
VLTPTRPSSSTFSKLWSQVNLINRSQALTYGNLHSFLLPRLKIYPDPHPRGKPLSGLRRQCQRVCQLLSFQRTGLPCPEYHDLPSAEQPLRDAGPNQSMATAGTVARIATGIFSMIQTNLEVDGIRKPDAFNDSGDVTSSKR